MYGGRILEARPDGDRLRLWVIDDAPGMFGEVVFFIALDAGRRPEMGDFLRWPGDGATVYWTTCDGCWDGVPLHRVSPVLDPAKGALAFDPGDALSRRRPGKRAA